MGSTPAWGTKVVVWKDGRTRKLRVLAGVRDRGQGGWATLGLKDRDSNPRRLALSEGHDGSTTQIHARTVSELVWAWEGEAVFKMGFSEVLGTARWVTYDEI